MSDPLNHECGLALVRLRQPLDYFLRKYGTGLWGFQKLFLLMEKQHNRGQDGVGIGCTKLHMPIGQPYMHRARSQEIDSLGRVFRKQLVEFEKLCARGIIDRADGESVKRHFDFGGECLMGHLRYGTSGEFGVTSLHPYLRRSNWPTKTLMVLGNFNMANAAELNQILISRGQHPIFDTDTQTVLEEIGYHLDEEHTDIYRAERDKAMPGERIPAIISERLDVGAIIRRAAEHWDGGYAIAGMIGNGDCFVMRDPHGIRPCHYYMNDEVIAFASERVPLMTVFGAAQEDVHELARGTVLFVKADGRIHCEQFASQRPATPCSFERIYFSRGNDPAIYRERKALGAHLVPQIIEAIGDDFDRSVVSFIPNTAEVAYQGLMDELRRHRRRQVRDAILDASRHGRLDEALLDQLIMRNWPRGEKIAHKDIKLRTFISQEAQRESLANHVYDVTYGEVRPEDVLVCIDDSIVRGTTLKQSILKILARTGPKAIVIVSTAPQIRYPDCYGIDMAQIGKFIAFEAAIALLKESGRQRFIDEVFQLCLAEVEKPSSEQRNCVKDIYAPFTHEEIAAKISQFVYPNGTPGWHGEVRVIFQTVENLHRALGSEAGDWYFTGNYPTPAGVAVCNRAFIHWYEKKTGRPYDLPGLV
ncbi:MAG: amidophosphoribosyltransferase [Verrucomicrobiales bacterium]